MTPATIYEYIKNNGGIATDQDYPYTNDIQHCYYDISMDGVQIVGSPGYQTFLPKDDEALKQIIIIQGPVIATMGISPEFFSY